MNKRIHTDNRSSKACAIRPEKGSKWPKTDFLLCLFTGCSLSRAGEIAVKQKQHEQLRKLEELPNECSIFKFRSMKTKLAWLANSRSRCLLEIPHAA